MKLRHIALTLATLDLLSHRALAAGDVATGNALAMARGAGWAAAFALRLDARRLECLELALSKRMQRAGWPVVGTVANDASPLTVAA